MERRWLTLKPHGDNSPHTRSTGWLNVPGDDWSIGPGEPQGTPAAELVTVEAFFRAKGHTYVSYKRHGWIRAPRFL